MYSGELTYKENRYYFTLDDEGILSLDSCDENNYALFNELRDYKQLQCQEDYLIGDRRPDGRKIIIFPANKHFGCRNFTLIM